MDSEHKYDDIIDLPHHISKKHPQLDMSSYAAQFSPFAALTGYDGIITETARSTVERDELGEDQTWLLNAKMNILVQHITEHPQIEVTYFEKDKKKSGGAYLKRTGCAKRIDVLERIIFFADGTRLSIDDITDMRGEIFRLLENAEFKP